MKDEEIDKIAQAIAAKLAQPAGQKLLGCGSVSSSEYYDCHTDYRCTGSSYECGGAGLFRCLDYFACYSTTTFTCRGSGFDCPALFFCSGTYNT